MIRFHAAPAIQTDYRLLHVLSPDEIEVARQAGYAADNSNPSEVVSRPGIDIDSLDDWMLDDSDLSD